METFVKLRNPMGSHEEMAVARVDGLRPGFLLNRGSKVQFQVSRADPNPPEFFELGVMVSVEREDGFFPWVGFIDDRDLSLGSPVATITASDHALAIFEMAR